MNRIYKIDGVQDSVPSSSAGTGTITSVNNKMLIIGVGTAFSSEFRLGDYIYIKGQNDFREVVSIMNDTELIIDRPFDVNLSASAFDITPRVTHKEHSITVDSGTVLLNNVQFSVKSGVSEQMKDTDLNLKKLTPVDVNATGGVAIVVIQY